MKEGFDQEKIFHLHRGDAKAAKEIIVFFVPRTSRDKQKALLCVLSDSKESCKAGLLGGEICLGVITHFLRSVST